MDRPIKELKGFSKVSLLSNETKTVTFSLDSRSFSSWWKGFGWYAEQGKFAIQVGSASDDIRLNDTVILLNSSALPSIVADTIPAVVANLAQNKPVKVSSTEKVEAAGYYAVDGVFGTRWSSATGKTSPEWIYVDLQQTYKITEVRLAWETAAASAYQIQVSDDAVNWTNIYSTTTGDGGTDDITGLSSVGRYIRMYGTKKQFPQYGYSLWEFAVFGSLVSQNPYGGIKWSIPGVIEAENYDTGGEGAAYHETTTGNTGAVYRNDDVDIQSVTDTGGGYSVCNITKGEWLEYSVFIPTPGFYTLDIRVARLPVGNSSLHVECDGNDITGLMSVPSTGEWQTWSTITKTGIYLNTINQTIKLYSDGGDFNVNWLKFTVDTTTDIAFVGLKKLFLYPNPVINNLCVKFEDATTINYTIKSIEGRIVLRDSVSGNTANVNMHSIKNGIYFISVNGSVFRKIIKL